MHAHRPSGSSHADQGHAKCPLTPPTGAFGEPHGLFERLNAALLCAVCKPENADSAEVMTRLGMSYRGLERW